MQFVTVEQGSDGRVVMVEPTPKAGLTRRAFWRSPAGHLEWCAYDDWRANGERARWYGYASRELPESMRDWLYPVIG